MRRIVRAVIVVVVVVVVVVGIVIIIIISSSSNNNNNDDDDDDDINHLRIICILALSTGGYCSQLHGNDEDNSPGENSVHHLHSVRLLLEPVHRRVAVRQRRQPPVARSHVHVNAGAPSRQSQFRNLRPEQPRIFSALSTSSCGLLPSSAAVSWQRRVQCLQQFELRRSSHDREGSGAVRRRSRRQ